MPASTRKLYMMRSRRARGGHLTVAECARAQGYRQHIQWPTERNALHLLGNTMSMCIVERLVPALLNAVYPGLQLRDPWLNGGAPHQLRQQAAAQVIQPTVRDDRPSILDLLQRPH